MADSGSSGGSRVGKKGHSLIEEKVRSRKFNHSLVKEIHGTELTVGFFQEHGFSSPVLVKDKSELGLRVPHASFTVSDMKEYLNCTDMVQVTDMVSKDRHEMTLTNWIKYYESKERSSTLSVNCMEISFTSLEGLVEPPDIVRQVDWLYQVWPAHLVQKADKNQLPSFPQMQRFCTMTVSGCFTDFHVDLGGTSVWYHALHGNKIVWLIQPTEENVELFEEWCNSVNKSSFFADEVKQCQRLNIEAGSTLFIPSGWIHAIYSPVDAISFSGNFLHSFSITEQLHVFELELRIRKISQFTLFCQMQWYALERYVDTIGHVSHRVRSESEVPMELQDDMNQQESRGRGLGRVRRGFRGPLRDGKLKKDNRDAEDVNTGVTLRSVDHGLRSRSTSQTSSPASEKKALSRASSAVGSPSSSILVKPVCVKLEDVWAKDKTGSGKDASSFSSGICKRKSKAWIHLSPYELSGLNKLINFLEGLPVAERHVPSDIPAPDELLHDAKVVLAGHAQDDAKLAITGRTVLSSWSHKDEAADKVGGDDAATASSHDQSVSDFPTRSLWKRSEDVLSPYETVSGSSPSAVMNNIRRRRVRCRKCEACTRAECGECLYCKDMKKFGGLGRMKQTCVVRQCVKPILPTAAVCVICNKGDSDGTQSNDSSVQQSVTLMECNVCWKIVHPQCLQEAYPQIGNEGIINEELPNSWECPKCCEAGEPQNHRARSLKGINFLAKQHDNLLQSSSDDTVEGSEGDVSQRKKRALRLLSTKTKLFAKKKHHFMRASGGLVHVKRRKLDENDSPLREKLLKLRTEKLKKKAQRMSGDTEPIAENGDVNRTGANVSNVPSDISPQLANIIIPNMAAIRKYVVRPAPVPPPPKFVPTADGAHHPLKIDLWIRVFGYLPRDHLARCMSVCKTWYRWASDRHLWQRIDLSRRIIRRTHLIGIVRRQPSCLDLSWSNISHQQLAWLAERLPYVRELRLAGNSWPAVSSLCGCRCPLLTSLDIGWVSGVYDACIRDLVLPPRDHRPGLDASSSRLRRCNRLVLSGTDITDESLEIIAQHVPSLEQLDLSYCVGIGDDAVRILAESSVGSTLTSISLAGCIYVTNACFRYFERIEKLQKVNVEACPEVDEKVCVEFAKARADCVVSYKEIVNYVK